MQDSQVHVTSQKNSSPLKATIIFVVIKTNVMSQKRINEKKFVIVIKTLMYICVNIIYFV